MAKYKGCSTLLACALVLGVMANSIGRPHFQGQSISKQETLASARMVNRGILGKQEPRVAYPGKVDGKAGFDEVTENIFVSSVSGGIEYQEPSPKCECNQGACNCSKRHLQDVPDCLTKNTTELNLSYNYINSLKSCAFCNYTQLRLLFISSNRLETIAIDAFKNLSLLEVLSLENNTITLPPFLTDPSGIFRNLPSLKSLRLGRNKNLFTHYQPDLMLVELENLQELFMDGQQGISFGPGFRNLTSLKNLTLEGFIQGNCSLTTLANEKFTNLYHLTYLDISTCKIENIDIGVFEPLQKLEFLNISFNYRLGVEHFMTSLSRLRQSNIIILSMSYINSYHSPSVKITKVTIKSLPRKLISLEAMGNSFEVIDSGILQHAPENLTYVNLGNNRIIYGEYFKDLFHLKNLITLKLSGSYNVPYLPDSEELSLINAISSFPNGYNRNINSNKQPLFIKLPPQLSRIEMDIAGLKYILSGVDIDTNNSLKTLSMSKNYFPVLMGPITGLEQLTCMDFRQNLVDTLQRDFFRNLKGLKHLNLARNALSKFFKPGSMIFYDLKNLISLDLSGNDLRNIPQDLFVGLNSLEILLMNFSSMWNFNVTVSHLRNLKLVNLTHSELSRLTDHVRHHIDSLCKNDTCQLLVDLSFNPIRCECENLDFLTWMVNSRAFEPSFTNYLCKYPDDSYKVINDSYTGTLQLLNRTCAENVSLFLAILAVTLLMLGFVVAGILYRYRWKFRYFYYAAYIKLKAKHAPLDKDNFRYDVFISYATNDEDFVVYDVSPELSSRGLRLHVHGRDFVVGDFIASNIVTAVRESRKTLVVLTRNLLASTWCNYELQMANMESVHTGRPVLVFLLKESIPTKELSTDLLYHIRNNTYILYPQNDEEMLQTKHFWNKLANDLKN